MLYKYLIGLFLFVTVQMQGQGDMTFFNAIKNNDMATVGNYFQDQIDFCIFDNQESISKKEALSRLNTFISKHKAQSIEVIHQGTSKGKTTQFKVAKLTTDKETYRIFVYTTSDFGNKSVKEIRIDKF